MPALINNLKQPSYALIAIGISFILFDISIYLMLNLIGSDGYTCIPAGNFTTNNVIFSIFISILTGIISAGIIKLVKEKHQQHAKISSLSGFALLIATLTMFCSVCTIPLLSIFGLATIAHIITDFNIYFQVTSICLLLLSGYLLNQQLEKNCRFLCRTK